MTNSAHQLLSGKKGVIIGIANKMSISWAIAKTLSEHGAQLALTYQGEAFKRRIEPLAEEINCQKIYECDVTNRASVESLFDQLQQEFGEIDFLVHGVAFSDKQELRGRYIDTSFDNFQNTLNISCYSLVLLSKMAEKLMPNGGSILTLTYYGSQKVVPNYNVMGVAKAALEASVKYLSYDIGGNNIRVNAISAGPIKTLAASGIGDFHTMLEMHTKTAPLKRNTTQEDVAGAALYLISDLSKGVTGEVHYVDGGYNIMGSRG